MLGAIWVGSIFPSHVPEDRVLLRVMVGGARDPEAPLLSEARTVDLVHGELSHVLGGIDGSPAEAVLFRHPKGIPQYVLGHPKLLLTLERELAKLSGLRLAGNAYRGIGVNDCVREAKALAIRVAESAPSASPVGGRV
jgi:oxygen-dependent protoporphyrinogen oxidase